MTAENDNDIGEKESGDDTLDVEMALLAIAATNDVGGPMGEIDLDSLAPAEKRALLAYLRHRFNLAPDPDELSQLLEDGQEPEASVPNPTPE